MGTAVVYEGGFGCTGKGNRNEDGKARRCEAAEKKKIKSGALLLFLGALSLRKQGINKRVHVMAFFRRQFENLFQLLEGSAVEVYELTLSRRWSVRSDEL